MAVVEEIMQPAAAGIIQTLHKSRAVREKVYGDTRHHMIEPFVAVLKGD
ncbi:MAG: hypothetical protein WC367_00495 [Methanoregula sp.]